MFLGLNISAFDKMPDIEKGVISLEQGSNIDVPGVYVFEIVDGYPRAPSGMTAVWPQCERNMIPDQCQLYSTHTSFILKGFFCDSKIPRTKDVQIVFEGAFNAQNVEPFRIDAQSGDVEAFFPFWGVSETAILYLLVSNKEKRQSTMEVNFVSVLETFGFPPYVVTEKLQGKDEMEPGWPENFKFKSRNLLLRSTTMRSK